MALLSDTTACTWDGASGLSIVGIVVVVDGKGCRKSPLESGQLQGQVTAQLKVSNKCWCQVRFDTKENKKLLKVSNCSA